MTWMQSARSIIAEIHADLPAEATLKQRRSALRKAAGHFHGGTSWGRKVWSRATREYLQHHGLPPLERQNKHLFPADIIFPFRDGGSA